MKTKTHTSPNRAMIAASAVLFLLMVSGLALANGVPAHLEDYAIDSRQPSPHASESPDGQTAWLVTVPEAPWLRVKIAEYSLSPQSYLLFTSIKDGSAQRQTALTLPQWDNMSAFFNGDAVVVELIRSPQGASDYFIIEDVVVGEEPEAPLKGDPSQTTDDPALSSICGSTDDRVPSTEDRPARLTFVFANGTPNNACSAWPVSNGAMLTAGHCVDFDPDQGGAQLPDGVLDIDANDVIEFNPPNSLANGALQFAPADDQYTMVLNSFTWNFDGENQGLGKDWAVFRCNPNPNTNLSPHVAQGFYRMTNGDPAVSNTIRITGYGTDGSPSLVRNQIQQTHTGPYQGEGSSGANFWHTYQVDTTGGNSGSPIIWDSNGFTIGIHTNAGCGNSGGNPTGANSGTSFEHDPLETALRTFPGANARFVDKVRFDAVDNGTIFHPYDTVAKGVAGVPSGGRLVLVRGTYVENIFINKPMLITAPVGNVTIGD